MISDPNNFLSPDQYWVGGKKSKINKQINKYTIQLLLLPQNIFLISQCTGDLSWDMNQTAQHANVTIFAIFCVFMIAMLPMFYGILLYVMRKKMTL